MGLEDLKPYEQISAEDVRRLAEDVSRNRRGRGQGYGADDGGINFFSGKMRVPEEDDWFIAELTSSSSPYSFKEKWYEGSSPAIADKLNGRIGNGTYNPLYLLAGATGTSGDIILATRMPGNKDNYVGLSLKSSIPTVVTDICVKKEATIGAITNIYVTKSDGTCAEAGECAGCPLTTTCNGVVYKYRNKVYLDLLNSTGAYPTQSTNGTMGPVTTCRATGPVPSWNTSNGGGPCTPITGVYLEILFDGTNNQFKFTVNLGAFGGGLTPATGFTSTGSGFTTGWISGTDSTTYYTSPTKAGTIGTGGCGNIDIWFHMV